MVGLGKAFFSFFFAGILLLQFGCIGQKTAPAPPLSLPKEYELADYVENPLYSTFLFNYGPSYSGRFTKYDRWDAEISVISSQAGIIDPQGMFDEAIKGEANKVYAKTSYQKAIGSFSAKVYEANYSSNQTYGDYTGTLASVGLTSLVNSTMRIYHVENGCSSITVAIYSYANKENRPNYAYSLSPEIESAIANANLPIQCEKQIIAAYPQPAQKVLPASNGGEDMPPPPPN